MVFCCSSRCRVFLKVLLTLSVLWFLIFLSEAAPEYRFHLCPNNSTYNPNSTYQVNLNGLLSNLSSNNTGNNLFYTATAGNNAPDSAYGLFMCRGDVTIDSCRDCVVTATREIIQKCPEEKVAYIWYDECMLRYDNRSFFSTMDKDPNRYMWSSLNPGNVTEPDRFAQVLGDAMNNLATRASSDDQSTNGGLLKGFATGETNFTSFQTLYSLVQCTPDLSGSDCNQCFRVAIGQLPGCCSGQQGARVLLPSCNIRYETVPFYRNIATAAPQPTPTLPPPPATRGGNDSRTTIIIILVVSISGSLLLTVFICFILRKQKRKFVDNVDTVEDISIVESLQYDFNTISAATNDFADANKLGQGGFGAVYKGKLPNGKEIAVKRLSKDSGQGDLEFKNEVMLVAKLQHRNLVRLLGFCLEGNERLLIYELMPNASLDHLMFDPVKRVDLDWDTRYKIIGGVAKGLLYLHEDSRLRIVHRDLKASNVLLDEEMNPKISDFGMARLFVLDETQGNTSRIVGTYGYMAPEYVMYGQFSAKSDVFSFGILVLEIVSGEKNNSFRNGEHAEDLPSYAWKNWQDGTAANLIDPILRASSGSMRDIMRCIHIGLLCVQENVIDRPTMASVLLMLNSFSLTLPVPSEPAFLMRSGLDSKISRTDEESDSRMLETRRLLKSKSVRASINQASITELSPR